MAHTSQAGSHEAIAFKCEWAGELIIETHDLQTAYEWIFNHGFPEGTFSAQFYTKDLRECVTRTLSVPILIYIRCPTLAKSA